MLLDRQQQTCFKVKHGVTAIRSCIYYRLTLCKYLCDRILQNKAIKKFRRGRICSQGSSWCVRVQNFLWVSFDINIKVTLIILRSICYIIVMVEKHNFHIPLLQFVLLPSLFSLSLYLPLGILRYTHCLSLSRPSMRLRSLRRSASQASGPCGYLSLPLCPSSLYWIHFPANALQRPTPNWFHVGDIEFTVTIATSSRQGTLSLSWPPTLSPCVPPSTSLHTLFVGSIFSKRIFDIQYREKGVFFFPLLFPLSELSPPEHIQCIYIQVFPGPKADCSFKRRPVTTVWHELVYAAQLHCCSHV